MFDDLMLVQLVAMNDEKTAYGLSLASRFYLKTDDNAHGYGCRTAARQNDAYTERVGTPPPENKRTHYIGFYDVKKEAINALPLEHYDLKLRHFVENGERCHFQIELHISSDLGSGKAADKIKRNDRNTAMQALVDQMAGPVRHICACDAHLADKLTEIYTPDLPRSAT
ncbi:hypothetical protein [Agrobacterium pusense]|uniref:hypothetical protein n=1 Tax=Agrobacterium pusense TaxID=648995 RepID=UPI003FD63908